MKKFIASIIVALLMFPLIPFASVFAVSASAPLYTHFTYMFAHANILHWLINAWGIIIIHKLYSPSRCIAAYLIAVTISFIPLLGGTRGTFSIFNFQFSIRATPALGFSVILFFFVGYLIFLFRKQNKTAFLQVILFIIIGFFIPNMAATHHLLAFLSGAIYFKIETLILDISHFIKDTSP
jgi:membrane associated rhomboid family serine protease